MKFRITGQRLNAITGKYTNILIEFVDIDAIVEADDEFQALAKLPADGADLYVCQNLVIQPLVSSPAMVAA